MKKTFDRLWKKVSAAVGGCLTTLAAAVAMVVAVANTVLFTARDVISTVSPGMVRHVPVLGWFADQPRPQPGVLDGQYVDCEVVWMRTSFTGGWYQVTCDATEPTQITELEVTAVPVGGDPNGWVYEEQRPMSGETITIDAGDHWTYEGRLAIGWDVLPWQDVPRQLIVTGVVAYPEEDASKRKWHEMDHPEDYDLQLVSAEPY